MRLLTRLALAALAAPSLSAAQTADARPSQELGLPVVEHTLENGMRFLVLERHTAPTVAFVVQYAVGGVNERTGETGIAHMLEHMLFKGSTTVGTRSIDDELELFPLIDAVHDSILAERGRGDRASASELTRLERRLALLESRARQFVEPNEFNRLLSENGARGLNATTSAEETVYFVELPSNRLELWMILEADRRLNPVFREFHTERRVVMEERRMRVDTDPAGLLYEAHLAAAFQAHPYGQPVVGHMSDLASLSRAQTQEYFNRFYGARNTVVSIVGDIDAERVIEWADAYFSAVPAGEAPPRVLTVEPPQRGERRVEVLFDAEPRLRVGWHVPAQGHPDRPALSMMSTLLTGGRSSRLHKRLVIEERSASVVSSSMGPGALYPGLFTIDALPSPGHDVLTLERAFEEEIARLVDDPPTELELRRVRNQLDAGQVRRLQSNLGLAFQLAGSASIFGDWRETFRLPEDMARVTASDVQRVAAAYFGPSRRTVAILRRPRDGEVVTRAEAVEIPDPAPSMGLPLAERRPGPSPRAGPGGPRIGRPAALDFEPGRVVFDPPEAQVREVDGVPVVFIRDRELPLVNVFFRFRGGFSYFPRSHYGAITALSSNLRNGGTVHLSPDSVDVLLDVFAIQSSFGGGGEALTTSFNVLERHFAEAFALWRGIIREPGFDSTEVAVWRSREADRVRRRNDAPAALAYSEFNRIMFGDHPIGWELGPMDLDPEDVNRTVLSEIHRQVYCPENLVMGVAGNIPWERVEQEVETLLEGWPSCPRELPSPPVPTVRSAGGVFLIPKQLDQATIVLGQPGAVRQDGSDDFFASRIANSILGASGLSSRLMQRVRSEAGYAYGASSVWTSPRRNEGILGAVTQSRSETAVAAAQLILSEMEDLARRAPSNDEVDGAIKEITNGYVFGFQSASQIVARRISLLAQQLPDDWLERYVDRIQRVRPVDVRDIFAKTFDRDRITVLVVGDPEALGVELEELGPVTVLDSSEAPGN